MAKFRVVQDAVLMTVLCIAVLGSGPILMKEGAHRFVKKDTYHVCLNSLMIFFGLFFRTLLSQVGYLSYRKLFDTCSKLIVMSLLLGSTTAWRVPSLKSLRSSEKFGPMKGEHGSLDCTGERCEANIDVSDRLLIREGHGINFMLKDNEMGDEVKGRIYVKQAETVVGYVPNVYMPIYDLVHKSVINSEDKENYGKWKVEMADNDPLRGQMNAGNNKVYMSGTRSWRSYPTYVSTRRLGDLSDKYKCGSIFNSDVEFKQIYSLNVHEDSGHVQFSPTEETSLNLTICMEIDDEKCLNTMIRSDEEISFDMGDFKILVDNSVRPRRPAQPPLMAYYEQNNKFVKVSEWKVLPYELRGQVQFGQIGALQTSCLYTKENLCDLSHFELEDRVDWNLESWHECSDSNDGEENKDMEISQDGVITLLVTGVLLLVGGAAITGGVAWGNSCQHCNVRQTGIVGPEQMKRLASQFKPIKDLYPSKEKILPDAIQVHTKADEQHMNGFLLKYKNFEDSHLDITVKGTGIVLEIPQQKGEIENWKITNCNINMAGGVSTCHYVTDFNGEEMEKHVWTDDGDIVILTDGIVVSQGRNEGEIGIESVSKVRDIGNICVGTKREKICATPDTIDITENPNVVKIITSEDKEDHQGSGGAWDFKGFWDSLTKWWQKAIMIVVWIIGIVCVLILAGVGFKLMRMMIILCSFKKADSIEVDYNGVVMRVHNESKNVSIKLNVKDESLKSDEDWLNHYVANKSLYNFCMFKSGIKEREKTVYDLGGGRRVLQWGDRRMRSFPDYYVIKTGKSGDIKMRVYDQTNPVMTYVRANNECTGPKTICEPYSEKMEDLWDVEKRFHYDEQGKDMLCNGAWVLSKIDNGRCMGYGEWKFEWDEPVRKVDYEHLAPLCIDENIIVKNEHLVCISSELGNGSNCPQDDGFGKKCVPVACSENCEWDEEHKMWRSGWTSNFMTMSSKLRGSKGDFYGLNCEVKTTEELVEEMKSHCNGQSLTDCIPVLDMIDNYNTVVNRSYSMGFGFAFFDRREESGNGTDPIIEKNQVLYPMAFYPWETHRTSAMNFVARIADKSKDNLPLSKQVWMSAFKRMFKWECKDEYEVKIEVADENVWMSVSGRTCKFVRPDNGKEVRVGISKRLPVGKAMFNDIDKLVTASDPGAMSSDCVCIAKTLAMCPKNESIGVFHTNCGEFKAYDGSKVYKYEGGYHLGNPDAELEFKSGKVFCKKDFVYTRDNGNSYKLCEDGNEMKDRGYMNQVKMEGEDMYYMYSDERNCSGLKIFKCLEEDNRGVFWLSFGAPVLLIVIIMLFTIIKCMTKCAIKRRMKKGSKIIGMSSDAIINLIGPGKNEKKSENGGDNMSMIERYIAKRKEAKSKKN